MSKMFKKVLIANRGEIALRVMRACQEMGITPVTVYSDVDRTALHVRKSSESYSLGRAPAKDSYLNIGKILDVARHSKAEAIHPGYGFLSENAQFAEACDVAGVKFIGPTAAAMNRMGSKTQAREAMMLANVPCVPGSAHGVELAEATRLAEELGYPVMLKAAAGGGGKGMRLVRSPQELTSAFNAARSEADRSFSDTEIYLEKFIENPRHIEMQILADEHGQTVYLGERECSIQRRHQKVLEEAPSPIVGPEMRQRMGEIAVRASQTAGYTNAGTVEFLVDEAKTFYFLEMNTRLQVEHPVTELITGLDLVQLQIRIAAGEPLPFSQSEVQVRGHAMECRIYAEDPDNNFFPSPGQITLLDEPSGPGVRLDSGIYQGWTVPIDYDPLLSKLIGYGSHRQQSIMRLRRALQEYFIGGIKNNLSLFERILRDPEFLEGRVDTGFLDRLLSPPARLPITKAHSEIAAVAAGIFAAMDNQQTRTKNSGGHLDSGWKQAARVEGTQ